MGVLGKVWLWVGQLLSSLGGPWRSSVWKIVDHTHPSEAESLLERNSEWVSPVFHITMHSFFFFTSAKPKTRQAETGPLFPYLQMISASVMIILKVSLGVDWSKGQLWLYNIVLNSLSKYTFICGKLVCTWLPLHLCTCLWNVFKNVGSLACQSCLADWSSIWSPTFGFIWCLRHNQSQSLVLLGPPWSGGQSSTWIHHLPGHGDLMGLWLCWWCYSCHQALT